MALFSSGYWTSLVDGGLDTTTIIFSVQNALCKTRHLGSFVRF